jgi:hypothetical protein
LHGARQRRATTGNGRLASRFVDMTCAKSLQPSGMCATTAKTLRGGAGGCRSQARQSWVTVGKMAFAQALASLATRTLTTSATARSRL